MTAHHELDDILEEALKDEDVGTEEHGIRMDESFMSWGEEEGNNNDWFRQEMLALNFPLHNSTSTCTSTMILECLENIIKHRHTDTNEVLAITPGCQDQSQNINTLETSNINHMGRDDH